VDEDQKMLKRKKKRDRGKTAKRRKKILKANGVDLIGDQERAGGEETEEFEYTPIFKSTNDDGGGSESTEQQPQQPKSKGQTSKPLVAAAAAGEDDDPKPNNDAGAQETRRTTVSAVVAGPPPSFSNDGSFMELMKQQMAAQTSS